MKDNTKLHWVCISNLLESNTFSAFQQARTCKFKERRISISSTEHIVSNINKIWAVIYQNYISPQIWRSDLKQGNDGLHEKSKVKTGHL